MGLNEIRLGVNIDHVATVRNARGTSYPDPLMAAKIVKEAGGFVDFFEKDKNLPLKKNILATNSNIHEELRDLINKKVIE